MIINGDVIQDENITIIRNQALDDLSYKVLNYYKKNRKMPSVHTFSQMVEDLKKR